LPVDWLSWLVLPSGSAPQGHHGYWLLLVSGALSRALLPVAATLFAFVAGIARFGSIQRVDLWRIVMGRMIIFGLALIALGLIPVVAMLGDLFNQMFTMRNASAIGKHASYLAPVLGGITSMLFDRRKGGNNSGRMTTIGLGLLVYGLLIFCYHLTVHRDLLHTTAFIGHVVLAVVLAVTCNINRVSIHAYYRARLSEAFLPNIAGHEVADPGDVDLDRFNPEHGAPLHVINTTLNTTSSGNTKRRSREGASFFYSPIFAGSSAPDSDALTPMPKAAWRSPMRSRYPGRRSIRTCSPRRRVRSRS
jgi:hypothetical protein